jgi:hypothetical protein
MMKLFFILKLKSVITANVEFEPLVAFFDDEVFDDAEMAPVALDCPAAKSELVPFLLPAVAFVEELEVSAELDPTVVPEVDELFCCIGRFVAAPTVVVDWPEPAPPPL